MKKYLYLIVALLCLVSCNSKEEVIHDLLPYEGKGNFETFAIYGEVHNALLNHMSENFSEPLLAPTTKNDAIDHVLAVQLEGVEELSLPESEKVMLSEGIESFKRYYVTADLINAVQPDFSRSSIENDDEDLTTEDVRALIKEAYDTGSIDNFEYQSFLKLIDYVLANASGNLSNEDFEIKVNSLISQWEVKYADVDFSQLENQSNNDNLSQPEPEDIEFKNTPKGALGGVVLNVSRSSLNYWEEEPLEVQSRAVPVFVGADIAGAVIGACSSALSSRVLSGNVNWKGVAWGAASGAVVGSTGIVGKVGKWISKLL